MKRRRPLIATVSVLLVAVIWLMLLRGERGNSGNSGNPEARMYADRALNVFNSLQAGDYQVAVRDFANDGDGALVTAEWSHLMRTSGSLKECVITHAEDEYENRYSVYAVYVTCKFERRTLYAVVRFNPRRQIGQFSLSNTRRL